MSDGVLITIEMVIKPELAEQVCAGIPQMFEDTVKFKGFRSIRVVKHEDEPNRVLIVEHWDSKDDYQAYQDWRNKDGQMEAAYANLLSFKAEYWPTPVGYKAV